MNGQKYYISVPSPLTDITVNTTGSPIDLAAITAAAAVPFFVEQMQVNCGVNAAQVQKISPVLRSTAGSGAGGSLGVRNASPSGPSASLSASYLVATPGTLSGTPLWSEDWQQFGGFDYDKREDGVLVPAGITYALNVPAVPVQFTMNVNGTVTEAK